jgi:hypothetical protein
MLPRLCSQQNTVRNECKHGFQLCEDYYLHNVVPGQIDHEEEERHT